jgi:hypothetical protein
LAEFSGGEASGAEWMTVEGWNSASYSVDTTFGMICPGAAGRTIPRIFLYKSRMMEQVEECAWKKSGENG